MKYYSTNHKCPEVDLRTAVLNGLPPDNGLYMPLQIHPMAKEFFAEIHKMTLTDIAFRVISHLTEGVIPDRKLKEIVNEAFNFPVISTAVGPVQVVELWHGPTMAFKDFGARFMSRLFSYFLRGQDRNLTILTATSGDTGGAVAAGFFQAPNIDVVILYPVGKVSEFQERQMTTWGDNIQAVAVEGTFDDCQALVKKAFLDDDLRSSRPLSSANSINLARLIPQTVYYFEALKHAIKHPSKIVVSVPSGNFGNLTAGVMAQRLGLPIHHFIAATNKNKVVPDYLESGIFEPKKSQATISNAMDVGNPSNFYRLLDLYNNDYDYINKSISGYSYDDKETRRTIKSVYEDTGYLLDPHSAIGYQAMMDYKVGKDQILSFSLSTAHPYKFEKSLSAIEGIEVPIPESAEYFFGKESAFSTLPKDYKSFKAYLSDKN